MRSRFRQHQVSWAILSWTLGTLTLSVFPALFYVGWYCLPNALEFGYYGLAPFWATLLEIGRLLGFFVGTAALALVATGPGGTLGLIIGFFAKSFLGHRTTVLGCSPFVRYQTGLLARFDIPETDLGGIVFASSIGWALFLFAIAWYGNQHFCPPFR